MYIYIASTRVEIQTLPIMSIIKHPDSNISPVVNIGRDMCMVFISINIGYIFSINLVYISMIHMCDIPN